MTARGPEPVEVLPATFHSSRHLRRSRPSPLVIDWVGTACAQLTGDGALQLVDTFDGASPVRTHR